MFNFLVARFRQTSSRQKNSGYESISCKNRSSAVCRNVFRRKDPAVRFAAVLCIAAAAGLAAGFLSPGLSESVSSFAGNNTASGEAVSALFSLVVEDNPKHAGYKRDSFGFRKTDEDGNGCDIREDILARDLKNIQYAQGSSCKVSSGVLDDPYTGKTINFVRGTKTSATVQIDHVVALNNAWQSGAYEWDTQKRYKYANDPYNLLAVDGPANEEKSDASAAYWLPSNKDFACEYVARQIGIKAKYGLTVTSAEKNKMMSVLHSCPAQTIPGE